MDKCSHSEAVYGWTGDSWSRSCSCGLSTSGAHPSAEEADREWRKISRPFMDAEAVARRVEAIRLKESVGGELTEQERVVLAYAPVEVGGTAPSCPSVSFARPFLLGST